MVLLCQVLLGREILLCFTLTVCFLVLINSTIPLGAQSIFQKTSFSNIKLDQGNPSMLGRMRAWPAAILGSRSTRKYSFKSTRLLPSSSDRATGRRKFSKFMAICQEWMITWAAAVSFSPALFTHKHFCTSTRVHSSGAF